MHIAIRNTGVGVSSSSTKSPRANLIKTIEVMKESLVKKFLDLYEKARAEDQMYLAQIYLEAAGREMNND